METTINKTLTETIFHDLTSPEIKALIFKGATVDEPRTISHEWALAIVSHPGYDHLDRDLTEWAWNSVELEN